MILCYGLLCGLLLAVFSQIDSLTRFAFSLGALLAGVHFFKREERLAPRIWFVVTSIIFYFMITIVITVVLIAQGKIPLPEAA
ncbi:hypothetical protein EBB07_32520 [Paenibacillaceae bacterium]|nr:hypothetical protein EBB07_32520 [Paenibacillaceae bacterium]